MDIIYDGKNYECIEPLSVGRYDISKCILPKKSECQSDSPDTLFYVEDRIGYDRVLFDLEDARVLHELLSKVMRSGSDKESLLMWLDFHFSPDE